MPFRVLGLKLKIEGAVTAFSPQLLSSMFISDGLYFVCETKLPTLKMGGLCD